MKKIQILNIFGTRPEATKMVPLIKKLEEYPDIAAEICVTAQHRTLLDQVLEPFNIRPKYDLNVMTDGQSLTDVVCKVLTGLPPIIQKSSPDLILVHGDTATTFAASLAAFYARIPVGHVEAGLRTHDKYRPYPEEINRKLTTALADLYFAPTEDARNNLLAENIPDTAITVTGNTAVDFIRYTEREKNDFNCTLLNSIDFTKRVIILTSHRSENLGKPQESICRAVKRLAADFPDVFIVWPMHPNPKVTETARKFLSGRERILLAPHLDVFDLHNLFRRAYLIMTDSGGIQEEAPAFHLPTVVLREVTERPEGLQAGTLVLAGTDESTVYDTAARLLSNAELHNKMASTKNPFGDGRASERIIKAIRHYFTKHPLP